MVKRIAVNRINMEVHVLLIFTTTPRVELSAAKY